MRLISYKRAFTRLSVFMFLALSSSELFAQRWGSAGYFWPDNEDHMARLQSAISERCTQNSVCYTSSSPNTGAILLNFSYFTDPIPSQNCSSGGSSAACVATSSCGGTSTLNPIDMTNGRKYLNEIDAQGIFQFGRIYEHLPQSLQLTPIVDYRENWIFGSRARRSLDTEASLDAYSFTEIRERSASYSDVEYILPKYFLNIKSGSQSNYVEFNTDGTTVFANNRTKAIIQKVSQLEANDLGLEESGYRLTQPSGVIEYFDESGRLMRTEQPNGTFEQYTYGVDGNGYEFEQVTNEWGAIATYTIVDDYHSFYTDVDGNEYHYYFDLETIANPRLRVVYPDNTPETQSDNPYREYEHISAFDTDGNPTALNGALNAIYDNGNLTLSYQYDPVSGRAIESQRPLGVDFESLSFSEGTNNHIASTAHTNALGKSTTYSYDFIGGQQVITQVDGQSTTNCAASNSYYTYDANGFNLTFTDENGNVTETLRNDRGLIETETQGLAWVSGVDSTLIETDASRRVSTVWLNDIALVDNRTFSQYDAAAGGWQNYLFEDFTWTPENRIDTYTQTDLQNPAKTRTTNYTYSYFDPQNTLLERIIIDGPRLPTDVNDFTEINYETNGVVGEIRNALGHGVMYRNFNGAGQAREVIDANGVQTNLTYTPRGWLETSTIVHPADSNYDTTTTFGYDGVGQIILVTLDDGQQIHFEYDDARRLTAIQNHIGERYEFILDNAGNVTQESIENLSGTTVYQLARTFDELSRVMDITGNDGQNLHYDYDVNNNVTNITNANTAVNSQTPDALNRLQKAIDPYLQETDLTYDAQDRITSITDARDNTTTYTYDGLGNLEQLDSPDTGITTYQHDAAGNITQSTDARGVVTNYVYDALNRLEYIQYPVAQHKNVTYFYDNYNMDSGNPDPDESASYAVGRLTGIDSEFSSIRYYYDYRGNITKQKETLTTATETNTYTTRYSYRFDNQVETILYTSGMLVTYTFNSLGQVNGSTVAYPGTSEYPARNFTVASNITYMPFGPMNTVEFGSGIVETHNYDIDYRLINIATTGTALSDQIIYEYDLNNNIDEIIDINNPFNNQAFNFDLLDRLDDASGNYGDIDYGYDAVGNRTSKDVITSAGLTTQIYGYAADSNRLYSVTTDDGSVLQIQDFDYDEVGNLTGDFGATTDISYDRANRPTTWYQAPIEMAYLHNPIGQRIQKAPVSGGTSYPLTTEPGVFSEDEYLMPDGTTWEEIALALYGTSEAAAQLQSVMGALGYSVNSDSLLASDLPTSLEVSVKATDQEDTYTLDTAQFMTEEALAVELNLDHSALSGNGAGPLTYSQLNGLSNSDSTLTKINPDSWSDGIFTANEFIPSGEDGWVEYRLVASITDVNLSLSVPGGSVYTPPFQFWLENGYIQIFENGAYIDFGSYPSYQIDDVLRIERAGSTVQFFQNGTLLHTSTQISTEDLTAKGFFYPQGASVNVSASFSSSASPDAYYAVQSGDTWSSIATLLYGDIEGANALEVALGSPALIEDAELTGLPNTLSYDTTQTVDPYLDVPSAATWESMAILMYGSSAATAELETNLSATYPIASTDQIPASAFASSIVVVTPAPSTDYALMSSPFLTERATTVDYNLDSSQLSGNGAGPLTYSQLNGLSNVDSTLSKTNPDGWGDGTFAANELIDAGADGWVEYQLVANVVDVNLSLSAPGGSVYTPPFQYWLENGYIQIFENGAYIDFGSFPTYQLDDVLRIERTGSTVQYFQNGTLLHTSTQISTEDLTAKGFFYPQGASVSVSASFSSSASPDAYYTVQAGDTWSSIASLLFGSADAADELEASLGSPVLTAGAELTGIPSIITDDDAVEAVPPYYVLPASVTWASLANTMYGTGNAEDELEAAVGSSITLIEGEEILQSDLPNTLAVVDMLPPQNYDVVATAITPAAYTTPSATTWESLATSLYGSSSVANELEFHLTARGYTLADGLLITQSDLPATIGGDAEVQTVQYVYNQTGQLIGEFTSDGELIKEYVWLGGMPLAQIVEGEIYYYHNDHLSTPQSMTDENQNVVWQVESQTPFGISSVNEDVDGDGQTIVNNLRFPGQYFDEETGLHYNWHRYYDPSLGRYTQSDPIGLNGGINTYGYAYQNPVKYADPTGLVVQATFNRTTGVVTVVDVDSGATASANAFSGTPGQYNPAPNGTYFLSHFPWLRPNYYALVYQDDLIDDVLQGVPSNYPNSQHMQNVRLHLGTQSHACVTVPTGTQQQQWNQINQILQNTQLGAPINIHGTNYPNYGTLTISGSGFGAVPSSPPSINIPAPQINLPDPLTN